MRLIIHYESSWRNSFLDGNNNEPSPKKGRKFIGSMTELKKQGHYINRIITKDTVMGVLNRLIGDQRKLYQSRSAENYYFRKIEDNITYKDIPKYLDTSEVVYIRNITGSEDQNSFTGAIKTNDPIFSSDYSEQLWGVLGLEFSELLGFIKDKNYIIKDSIISLDPITIIERLEALNKLKAVEVKDEVETILSIIKSIFPDVDYKLNAKGGIMPISFYTSALYIQLKRLLANQYDNISSALTKSDGLSGISKRGFTKKDFMVRYTTGNKKLVFGNPYQLKERVKGMGEVTSLLTKSTGKLEILLDISYEKAKKIKQDIENAGVSSFYMGKKGLAWLDHKISLEELH